MSHVAGGGGPVSVTVACADDEGLATEIARTVTVFDAGITDGAENTPVVPIVPVAAEPPVVPFTC